MAKQVLVLLGSPRKNGNSALLARQIARGAKSAKAKVETLYLHGMQIAPCRGCWSCQKKGSRGCVIKDDMQAIYGKLIVADAWVIATPIFWFTLSAQTKLFMDRCFALPAYHPDPFRGKRIAVAMAYGGEDPLGSGCVNAWRTFQDACAYTEACLVGGVYGSAMAAGEIGKNDRLMDEAFALGRQLVAG